MTPASLVQFQLPQPHDAVPKWIKGADCKSVIRRFKSGPHLQMVPSSKWLGRQPLKLETVGSSPTGITIARRGLDSSVAALLLHGTVAQQAERPVEARKMLVRPQPVPPIWVSMHSWRLQQTLTLPMPKGSGECQFYCGTLPREDLPK